MKYNDRLKLVCHLLVSQINETNANDKITEQIVARVMQKLGSGWVIGTTTTSITIFAILKYIITLS